MQYWLMKSEADCYSIDDLESDKSTLWTGVRNYQARNFMLSMAVGDRVLFYHSSSGKETGVVGEAEVIGISIPDPTQFDTKSEYFDPKATKLKPRWYCVRASFIRKFKRPVYLSKLRQNPSLVDFGVLQKGSRLSVMPVSKAHFSLILKLGSTHEIS
jgi:predicted RNA-binding protein with PUA-like domain